MSFIAADITGDTELIRQLEEADRDTFGALSRAAQRLRPFVRDKVIDVFRAASLNAGEGFPPSYANQLMRVVASMPIMVVASEDGVAVEMDLEESLGTYEEFQEGFHYHASLGDGDWVELPYEGEELKNSYEQRLQFWESVATGTHIPGMRHTEGMYDETIAARVAYWNSLGHAPQWLLLNYGQTDSYPFVEPQPIIEEIMAIEYSGLGSIIDDEINNSLSRIFRERYIAARTTQFEYHTFPSKPNLEYVRDAKGRFAGSRRRA